MRVGVGGGLNMQSDQPTCILISDVLPCVQISVQMNNSFCDTWNKCSSSANVIQSGLFTLHLYTSEVAASVKNHPSFEMGEGHELYAAGDAFVKESKK